MDSVHMNTLALGVVELSTTFYNDRFDRLGYAEAKAGSRQLLVNIAYLASDQGPQVSLFERTCWICTCAAALLGGFAISLRVDPNSTAFLDGLYEGLIEGAVYVAIGSRTIDQILIETIR